MWNVYIVKCEDGSFYTGITTDIRRRFKEHKTGKGGHYTKSHKITKLLYTEKYTNQKDALRREFQIKGWRKDKKIKLIKFGKPNI